MRQNRGGATQADIHANFLFEDGGQTSAHCDSTPIIRRLEADFTARSVLPRDPALAFIDYLIEDFGDEWCTKYMFHYRWHFDADAENAASLLPLSMNLHLSPEQYEQYKAYIKDRQVNRLYVVGSNDITAPMIDASYRRFLQSEAENHLKAQGFMLGNRPAAGDFGIYGQLTQLITFDPTPRAIAHEISHRTVAWIEHMRDLSGIEPTDPIGWLWKTSRTACVTCWQKSGVSMHPRKSPMQKQLWPVRKIGRQKLTAQNGRSRHSLIKPNA